MNLPFEIIWWKETIPGAASRIVEQERKPLPYPPNFFLQGVVNYFDISSVLEPADIKITSKYRTADSILEKKTT